MLRLLCALTIAFGSAVAAQEGDPLQSDDCRRALDALQAQEAAASPRAERQSEGERRIPPRLETARRRAAVACLGTRADVLPPPGRFAQPPISVAPIRVSPPPVPPVVPTLPSPRRIEPPPPPVVTSCDAVGCWASDGSRLQRAGPNLVGPRGLCTGVPGAMLHCP